jgi:hypothetical protein
MLKLFKLAGATFFLLLPLSSCATMENGTRLADRSDVAIGQRANIAGQVVQPVRLLEDSRCPVNLRCVWAGRVRVATLWIRPSGENLPLELTLGEPAPIAGGHIILESVRPERLEGVAPDPDQYRFSFRFESSL